MSSLRQRLGDVFRGNSESEAFAREREFEFEQEREELLRKLGRALRELQLEFAIDTAAATTSGGAGGAGGAAARAVPPPPLPPAMRDQPLLTDLCTHIEFIFLHGLKQRGLFPGGGKDSPTWFRLIRHISPPDVVATLSSLCAVKSQAGRGRAFVRLALNDNALENYFTVLDADRELLRDFYQPWAFMADPERMQVARTLLAGLALMPFAMPFDEESLDYAPAPISEETAAVRHGRARSLPCYADDLAGSGAAGAAPLTAAATTTAARSSPQQRRAHRAQGQEQREHGQEQQEQEQQQQQHSSKGKLQPRDSPSSGGGACDEEGGARLPATEKGSCSGGHAADSVSRGGRESSGAGPTKVTLGPLRLDGDASPPPAHAVACSACAACTHLQAPPPQGSAVVAASPRRRVLREIDTFVDGGVVDAADLTPSRAPVSASHDGTVVFERPRTSSKLLLFDGQSFAEVDTASSLAAAAAAGATTAPQSAE